MRQLVAILLSAAAIVAMAGVVVGPAGAADMPGAVTEPSRVVACAQPQEAVVLFDEFGTPTVPGRTPYFYCVTGTTLIPGQIPPPPEYCCG